MSTATRNAAAAVLAVLPLAAILAACGAGQPGHHPSDSPAAASSTASAAAVSQATAPPQYVAAGSVSRRSADLDACKAWFEAPVPSKKLPPAVQDYDYDRPALRWLNAVSAPLAAALSAEQASDLAALRPGSDPATAPTARLQANAFTADCLTLYGSRLEHLSSLATTAQAQLTAHIGHGFAQTACDLLSPVLLNQWYNIATFGLNPGDSSLIDNVAVTSGVNQTGGSDCQYQWEPGYQLGGQISINFDEDQSPATVLQDTSDVGPARDARDVVAGGAKYAVSVGQSPSFTVVAFRAGTTSVAVSCTGLTMRQTSFVTAVVLLRLIAYHYPNDQVAGITTLP